MPPSSNAGAKSPQTKYNRWHVMLEKHEARAKEIERH
jgi:hypothetical protein